MLARNGEKAAPGVRARGLVTLAHLKRILGYDTAAISYAEASLALFKEIDDQKGIAEALYCHGAAAYRLGEMTTCVLLLEVSLSVARKSGDKVGMARALNTLEISHVWAGNDADARWYLEESLALGRELGSEIMIRMSLHNLAIVARNQGESEAASRYQAESLTSAQSSGEPIGMLYALLGQVSAAMAAADYVRAKGHLTEVAALAREMRMTKGWPVGLKQCAYIALHLSGPEKAARLFGATERLREETGEAMSPAEVPWYEEAVALVRAAYNDESAFARAWQEGRTLTREQAVDYALAPEVKEK